MGSDEFHRFVPRRGSKFTVTLGAGADERRENPVLTVDASCVMLDLLADEPGGKRIRGLIDGRRVNAQQSPLGGHHRERTGIGTIERARRLVRGQGHGRVSSLEVVGAGLKRVPRYVVPRNHPTRFVPAMFMSTF